MAQAISNERPDVPEGAGNGPCISGRANRCIVGELSYKILRRGRAASETEGMRLIRPLPVLNSDREAVSCVTGNELPRCGKVKGSCVGRR